MSEMVQSKFSKQKDAQATGIISKFDMKNPSVKVLYGVIWFFMILAVLLCFLPPLWCMTSALKDSREFFSVPATLIPRSFHPEKLWETWEMLNFGQAYLNTVIVLCGSLVMSLVCNGMMGYVLSRLRPRGYKLVLSLVLWTLMLPQSVSQVPLFKNFLSLPILGINITESYLPMWLLAGANAFYVLIFKSFFDSIPQSLIEAARLDGCTNLGIFFRVMLPLAIATSIDALATGVTFAMMGVNIWIAIAITGLTTFVFSVAGVKIGNLFGSRYQSKAELVGGLILIVMGFKILVEHLLGKA